jgi:hypothetical protein
MPKIMKSIFQKLRKTPATPHDEDVFQGLFPGSFLSCRALTARYRNAFELTLGEVELVRIEDLLTLEALANFLSIIIINAETKDENPLRLAIRTSQAMSLHRDGTIYGLGHLETEVRRRIWARLRFMDAKASKEKGCKSLTMDSDTLLQANVNDADLNLPGDELEGFETVNGM